MGFLFTFCQELLFVFSRGWITSCYHGGLLSSAENKLLLSSSKAQARERGSGCLGRKEEKHKWHLEDSLNPSFACELKLCQFMSDPSDWRFALIHHSEEWSPLQVRDISNKPILNFLVFLYHKATASPSDCSCWSSFCSTQGLQSQPVKKQGSHVDIDGCRAFIPPLSL